MSTGPRSVRSEGRSTTVNSAFDFPLTEAGRAGERKSWELARHEVVSLGRDLLRPFRMIHEIKGSEREMRRHPSLHGRAADSRVTRFFLWRKWTLIVILMQVHRLNRMLLLSHTIAGAVWHVASTWS